MEFVTIFLSFIILVIFLFLFTSSGSKKTLPLPPGTLGWPYIGETFQLYSQNPNVFFASKVKKYGSIFKTHVLGCRCVMISSPALAKLVLVTKSHLFKPTFPASKERMLGKQAIFFHQGDYHMKLRRLVLRAFTPESIKNIIPDIESIAVDSLNSWENRLINTFQEMKTFTFNVALLSIFGKDEVLYREDLKRCYYILEKGYNSMPINLPGTLFNKSMKARKELAQIVAKLLALRRENKNEHKDLLASFMEDKEGLTDEQIADNIIGVIFAARDTTASVLTWIVKYLAENPSVLQAVTVAPKPNTFMPFGNGTHSCPGNELAKLEILVLIHHLTTKYRTSKVQWVSTIDQVHELKGLQGARNLELRHFNDFSRRLIGAISLVLTVKNVYLGYFYDATDFPILVTFHDTLYTRFNRFTVIPASIPNSCRFPPTILIVSRLPRSGFKRFSAVFSVRGGWMSCGSPGFQQPVDLQVDPAGPVRV
ncbi:cytochrome P450 [Artemisia annua]|uniref:Cytochrome P450 n=1 Tax=Artemisia annua TaxID=35608 RepID=A0A2U1L9S2_ARTAN|nr:cytochrome P450 [Artemisia annua]